MSPDEWRKLTWFEWSLCLDGYLDIYEERLKERGELMAHIANCTVKKKNGGTWERKDFIPLPADFIVEERKLTMSEVKKHLGKFRHGK